MSAAITLADAIAALVGEKRAIGYKYDAEQRVLARIEAFSRDQFPELDALTEAAAAVAGLPAVRAAGDEPWVYDARITARRRSGRPRA